MTRRRLMALAEQLRRIEALAHDLALEIQRGDAINAPTTRDILERIRADAAAVHVVLVGKRQR